jgi:hypothetical protein
VTNFDNKIFMAEKHMKWKKVFLTTIQEDVSTIFILNENSLSLKKILSFMGYSLGIFPNQDVSELSKKLS